MQIASPTRFGLALLSFCKPASHPPLSPYAPPHRHTRTTCCHGALRAAAAAPGPDRRRVSAVERQQEVGSSTAAQRERLAGRAVLVPTSPGAPPGAPPTPPPPPSKGDILRGTRADIGQEVIGLPVRACDACGAGCPRQRPKLRASAHLHLRFVESDAACARAALQRAPPPPRRPDVMGPLGGVVGPLVRAWVAKPWC